MSNDIRRPIETARQVALELMELIGLQCQRVEIAGSIRRFKPLVGDIELVALPMPSLLPHLDRLVAKKTIAQAIYSNGTTRWGTNYRGLMFQGMRCEIFMADHDNWGYQYWLRTGPAEANTFVMKFCSWKQAPYRASGGYWWAGDTKLAIRTELALFNMLGMYWIEPESRTEDAYRGALAHPKHAWGFMPPAAIVQAEAVTQLDMFPVDKPKRLFD